MVDSKLILGLLGSIITIGIFVAGVIYNAGKQQSRIEALERWRESIRIDMHEISDKLVVVGNELSRLTTLIEERTDRRLTIRKDT